ncbi:MAG: ABC transporter substrate-binding protein [Thermomicrobiales bacterium]|nr:ABC transporter substrate-binding protein [Thermomicrobiales bacterium]
MTTRSSEHSLITPFPDIPLSRRTLLQATALGAGAAAALNIDGALAQDEPVVGGSLNVAIAGEPPTLDMHQTTAGIVSLVTWVMYEPLFTYDDGFRIIPMLAESHEVSEDGLTNTLKIRQGVLFHNGEEMKAADVVASIERWGGMSGHGGALLAATEAITIVDDYTIDFTMTQPFGTFVASLAENYQGCAIYPKSVIDAAGADPLTEGFIGTGPYKLAEWVPDIHVTYERFEEYSALEGEPIGHGGHKQQFLDEIVFIPAPDEASRVAGLQAGDYHYLSTVGTDQYGALSGDASLVVETLPPSDIDVIVINWRSPLTGDLKIREAIQAAISSEPILQAAHGEGFYRLDPGVMLQETAWHSTIGEERYNQANPELAKQYLEEAGYDGTPLRFMSTHEYQYLYNIGLVAAQQLEQAGFTVEFETYDWATLVERRGDETLWDLFPTSYPFSSDPTQLSLLQLCSWPGWWCSDETSATFDQLRSESDFDTRYGYWEQIQSNFYTEIPMVKVGDFGSIAAMSSSVGGFLPQVQLAVPFWNWWLKD